GSAVILAVLLPVARDAVTCHPCRRHRDLRHAAGGDVELCENTGHRLLPSPLYPGERVRVRGSYLSRDDYATATCALSSICVLCSLAYTPPSLSTRSACVPCSTIFPFSSTTSRSAACNVLSRWAIAKVVRPLTNRSSACWICFSVSLSTELVASSRIRMRGLLRMARAMLMRCRSPPLKDCPRSPTIVS